MSSIAAMLVSCWLEASSSPSAWISLDKGDNDLRLFLSYFLTAIQSCHGTEFSDAGQETLTMTNAMTLPSHASFIGWKPTCHTCCRLPGRSRRSWHSGEDALPRLSTGRNNSLPNRSRRFIGSMSRSVREFKPCGCTCRAGQFHKPFRGSGAPDGRSAETAAKAKRRC